MNDLEFARRVLYCIRFGDCGASDLLIRCRQNILRLEAAEKVEEEKAAEEKAPLSRRVDALVARVLDLESERDRREMYEAAQRARELAGPSRLTIWAAADELAAALKTMVHNFETGTGMLQAAARAHDALQAFGYATNWEPAPCAKVKGTDR